MKSPIELAALVLRELVLDIEAVGVKAAAKEWPDLVRTYPHAKRFLAQYEPEIGRRKAVTTTDLADLE